MRIKVAIVGAGGHGREVLQALRAALRDGANLEFCGFFDDRPDLDLLQRIDAPHLGPVAEAQDFPGGCYLGLGGGELKQRLGEGVRPAPPLVHPQADVGDDVTLGEGTILFAQATVTTHIALGRHVHIGRGAAVGHDTVMDDFVSVMPLASISGDVRLGARAFVGTGALVRQGLEIGADAVVGMGSVVLANVPAATTVVGNPARPIVRG